MIRNLLRALFPLPRNCYRKWYKMSFRNELVKQCDCIIKCKYPPPSTPSRVYIPSDIDKLRNEQHNAILLFSKKIENGFTILNK
jgi:hypothetical protein